MKTKLFKTKIFLSKFIPIIHYHIPLPKSRKELILGAKVIEGPEVPEDLH